MWRAREQSCCTVTWANRCRRRLPRLSSHAPRYVPHAARCTLELLQRHNYPSTSSAKALRMSNDSLAGKWTTLQLQLELPARVASSHLAQIRLRTPRHLAFSCQCLSLSLSAPLASRICILPSDERCPYSFLPFFFTFSHFPATA